MTSKDPFEESGYARLAPSGTLEAISADEAKRLLANSAYVPERDHAADPDNCFLCGVALTSDNRTEEHVFPRWLLRDADLWRERINLLNGTTIPYASLKIPSCEECNSFWLSKVESRIADAFRAGPDAVEALDQTTLALWIGKLYYGLHFKEIGLALDRRQPDGPTVLAPEHLRENLGELHHLMQALRGRAEFTRPMGSIIVLRTQVPDQVGLRFDYRDASNVAFIAVRIGATAVLASLLDWGAVSEGLTVSSLEAARQLDLHPYQFQEVAAAVGYAAFKFDGEFIYSISAQGDHDLLEPVLVRHAGSDSQDLFAPFSVREAAEVQAAFMGMAFDDIYDPEHDVVWTCLRNPDGEPAPMPLETVPMGTELITPLRARRQGIPGYSPMSCLRRSIGRHHQ